MSLPSAIDALASTRQSKWAAGVPWVLHIKLSMLALMFESSCCIVITLYSGERYPSAITTETGKLQSREALLAATASKVFIDALLPVKLKISIGDIDSKFPLPIEPMYFVYSTATRS